MKEKGTSRVGIIRDNGGESRSALSYSKIIKGNGYRIELAPK